MRLRSSLLWMAALPAAGANFTYHIAGNQPGGWPVVLASIGLLSGSVREAGVVVIPGGASTSEPNWASRVERGTILVLEGDSALAASFGFRAGAERVTVRSTDEIRAPKLKVVWEKPLDVARFEVPEDARVLARERRTGAPLVASLRRGSGGVLWLAAPPGPHGYDRFPYLPQALRDLGLDPQFRSSRLWAFFDSAYRARVDLEYFAPR